MVLFFGAAIFKVTYEYDKTAFVSNVPCVPLKYIDFVYYTLVTSYTLGYGDIYPNTFKSRVLVVIVLLLTFSIIGTNIS
jgi:hypothetical protein